ncbi:serine proteinase stubble-like isoform X2 [Neocloeon triangulifer]|nr:serine proteinase stubble-like isoform X2 [Neocloeon triangulifer]
MTEEAPPPKRRGSLLSAWTFGAALLLATTSIGAAGSPLGPPHPAVMPGNFARNIRNLECVSRKTQEKGTCMFALSCLKMNGTHLGVCVDRFYYGSCCKLPDLQQEVDLGGGDTNDITLVGIKKPVTAASVAETTTPIPTQKPVTTLSTTLKPQKPVTTATTPVKKPVTPATTAATTKKPVTSPSKPVTIAATTKPPQKPTPTSPPRKPEPTTAKPLTAKPTPVAPTKPTTIVAKPTTVVTKPTPVATKPTTAATKPPSKPPSLATKPTTVASKPTASTAATKPPSLATKPTSKPSSPAKPTQKPLSSAKPTSATSKPTSPTVSNEVTTSKPATTPVPKPIIEAVEEETNSVSGSQKPTSARPTPPTFPSSTVTVSKPAPTQRPTPPTFPSSSAKPTVTLTQKPLVTITEKPSESTTKRPAEKPQNVTDENWVQIELSTTSPASVATKPTASYPDGSLFTEEIPPSVSRPTPPTFPPRPSTTEGTTTSIPLVTDEPVALNMSDYKQICGRRLLPDGRIVGGTRSTFAKWPWQISLRQWRTSTYLHKCGAALLNENWAITAAHCVENVPPSDLLLRLGEHDLSTESEPHPHLERRVQIVASHPQFDSRTFEYDLALLRFYEPVNFQPNVVPICIPEDDKNYVGETAYVTGWGRLYEDGPLPSVMQEVSVPVLENAVCETMYRSAGYIEHIPGIFICAGWKKGGFDSCEGDSGGPMVIQRDDKRWTLAGVISWGIGCAEPNQPGVYTRISAFRDWINQILQF